MQKKKAWFLACHSQSIWFSGVSAAATAGPDAVLCPFSLRVLQFPHPTELCLAWFTDSTNLCPRVRPDSTNLCSFCIQPLQQKEIAGKLDPHLKPMTTWPYSVSLHTSLNFRIKSILYSNRSTGSCFGLGSGTRGDLLSGKHEIVSPEPYGCWIFILVQKSQ